MSKSHTMKRNIIVSIFLAFFLSVQAQAVIYPFAPIYPTNAPTATAEAMASQLSLEIVDLGQSGSDPYKVELRFYNNLAPGNVEVPGLPGIITAVAFEDGTLFDMGTPFQYAGTNVTFTEDSTPPPGTWGLNFDTTHFFLADADPPSSGPTGNGVNPTEALGIVFDLKPGENFTTFMAALQQGFDGDIVPGESLRIGIHVQSYGPGENYSDAFILTPIPPAVLLGMLGMCVAGVKLRKYA